MKYLLIILLFCSCTARRTTSQTVILDGSKSYDQDGKIVKYEWKVTNGYVTNTNAVITTAKVNNNSIIELIVTDDKGAKGSVKKQIN